jgi:hypothetical protein
MQAARAGTRTRPGSPRRPASGTLVGTARMPAGGIKTLLSTGPSGLPVVAASLPRPCLRAMSREEGCMAAYTAVKKTSAKARCARRLFVTVTRGRQCSAAVHAREPTISLCPDHLSDSHRRQPVQPCYSPYVSSPIYRSFYPHC